MSVTVLVTTRTTSHPYSVTSSTVQFSDRGKAEAAKSKIERELSVYGSGFVAIVIILEGTD